MAAEAPIPSGRLVRRVALGGAALLLATALWTRDKAVFVDSSYFLMAASLCRDGDLFLYDQEAKIPQTERHLTVAGHLAVPHTVGSAILACPFLFAGRAAARLARLPAEGDWSASPASGPVDRFRLFWYNASAVFCGFAALLVLYRLCRRLGSGCAPAVIALAAVFFSTEWWWLLFFKQGGSELIALLLIGLLLHLVLSLHFSPSLPRCWGFLLGLLLGMAALVRIQSAFWGLFLAAAGIVWWRSGQLRGLSLLAAGIQGAAGFALAFLPQALVFRAWFGSWNPDLYGAAVARESLSQVARLLLRQPDFLTLSIVPLLGLAGLFLAPRRFRPVVLPLWGVIALAFAVSLFRRGHIEAQLYLSSRYSLSLAPAFVLGLAFLFRRRWAGAAWAAAALFLAYVTFVKLSLWYLPWWYRTAPLLPSAAREIASPENPIAAVRAALRVLPRAGALLAPLFNLPRSEYWWSLLVLFPGVPLAAAAEALRRRLSRPARFRLAALALAALSAVNLVAVAAALRRTAAAVERWEREGRYAGCWRTLPFDWSNCVDDLQMRARLYLRDGQDEAALRMGLAAAAVKPIPEGEVPDLLLQLRRHPVLGPRLWEELRSRYGVPGAVKGARERSAGGLEILLDRSGGAFSDLIVVFPTDLAATPVVEVSSDGISWEAPLRTERWGDALWVWDFYERPWTAVRILGLSSSAGPSPREVFAIISPRHGRLAR